MPVCCGCSGLNVVPMGRRGRLECVTLLAGAGAFVNAAPVCRDGCGVGCVCVEYVDSFVNAAPVCRDDCGVCLRMCGMRSISRIVKLV